ncbi:MAG: ubiquinol-cytochrome c reductase iron-sulfur subunit [Acidimicrobiia bacterium]
MVDQSLLLVLVLALAAAVAGIAAVVRDRPRPQTPERVPTGGSPQVHLPPSTEPKSLEQPAPKPVKFHRPSVGDREGLGRGGAQRVIEVPPEEAGLTRRRFLNRATATFFGTYLALLGSSMLSFFWPRLTGGFGTKVDVGPIADINTQLIASDGRSSFVEIPEARAYIVPVTKEQLEASQFAGQDLEVDGVMALWWRCVHLGCKTPWCASSIGFECPCHGSRYTLLGEYAAGPAPRNLDRFVVSLTEDRRLIVDTSSIVQTPRAPKHAVPYPQGPTCV